MYIAIMNSLLLASPRKEHTNYHVVGKLNSSSLHFIGKINRSLHVLPDTLEHKYGSTVLRVIASIALVNYQMLIQKYGSN
jgi:hypothetical protein